MPTYIAHSCHVGLHTVPVAVLWILNCMLHFFILIKNGTHNSTTRVLFPFHPSPPFPRPDAWLPTAPAMIDIPDPLAPSPAPAANNVAAATTGGDPGRNRRRSPDRPHRAFGQRQGFRCVQSADA